MARWQRPVWPNDQVISPTGDTAFVGMDLKTQDPAQMLTGWYAEGYNVRLENGGMATRLGSLCPGALNFPNYGQIYGVGIFSDPNSAEWLVTAVASGVWFTRDGESPRFIPMTTVIDYTVEFSQSFNNLYMWRGPNLTPLKWEGDWSVYWQELPNPSTVNTIYTESWKWNSTISGEIATGTSDWTNTNTVVDIAETAADGTDTSTTLAGLQVNDSIKMVDAANPAIWVQWTITAVGVDQGTYVSYAVSWHSGSGTAPADGTPLTVTFLNGTGGTIATETWNWDTWSGEIATGTDDWTSTNTVVDVAKIASDGTNASASLILPKVNDSIKMMDSANSAVWVVWVISAVGVDQGSYISYAVSWHSGSGMPPANNTPLTVTFLSTSTADATRIPMPNAVTAETFSNRMLVPHDRDGLAISDISSDSYQWAVNDFRVNYGEADTLVRVFPWVLESVICFKQHSIYQLANVTGDLSSMSIQKLPGTLGLVGLKACTAVAGDIYYLDYSGVYQITQVFEGSPQTGTLPISDNIKPIINSINWNAAAGIRAENRREYVYFAVPLQNATRNNVLLVYNMVSSSWVSIDTFGNPAFRIDDLVKTNYIGERRLFAIDRQLGIVLLLEQGKTDLMGATSDYEYQIDFGVLTRGYSGVGPRNKFPRVGIDVSAWNPSFTVEAFVEGSNAKTLVSDRTKDRTKYEVFGKPAWNLENLNDDHASARRKDYSVGLPLMLGFNGVQIEREAASTERFSVDMYGRFCQFRIQNNQGKIGVRSVILEDYEDQRAPRTET